MPQDRAHLTIAQRVMRRVDLGFFSVIGASFTFTPLERLVATPGLAYLNSWVSIRLVGLILLVGATGLAYAMWSHRRIVTVVVLVACMAWMGAFAVALIFAAIFGDASFAAWAWPGYVALACWASLLSLQAGEV